MASQASLLSGSWFDQDDQSRLSARLKRTLVLSLVLHVVVLLMAVGLRLPQQGERPLTSVEVSLVSLPTPVRQTESAEAGRVGKSFRFEAGPCAISQGGDPQCSPFCRASNRARKEGTCCRIFSFRRMRRSLEI